MTSRVALFCVLFVSYAYFYQGGGWNQNSRFNLVRAITNDHSLRVDPYHRSTGDQAVFDGHYYSDKAPGLSLAAVPVVMAGRAILAARGGDPESYEGIAFLSWLATVFTAGLFTALAAVTLFDVSIELGATPGGALFGAITYGLATPMWPLATLFIGHAFSAACLVFAFAAATRIGNARLKPSHDDDIRNALIVGVAAGWATVSEFPAAVPAVVLAIYAAINVFGLGRARALKVMAVLAGGAAVCAAALMAYQYACFGSPFHLAYSSEQPGFEGMQTGVFGIHVPKLAALWQILFGRYRGLLPLAPVLVFAPLGWIAMVRRVRLKPDTTDDAANSDATVISQNVASGVSRTRTSAGRARSAAIVAASIATYYILLNASFTYWEGGWSYGPRHLSPAIPFLCLGLAALWTIAPRGARAALAGLTAYGAALSLAACATMAQPPASYKQPVAELLLPAFRDGDLALNTQRFTDSGAGALRAHVDPAAAWNLGIKAGLSGHWSLLPLALVWIGLAAALTGAGRGPRPSPSRADRTSSPAAAPRESP